MNRNPSFLTSLLNASYLGVCICCRQTFAASCSMFCPPTTQCAGSVALLPKFVLHTGINEKHSSWCFRTATRLYENKTFPRSIAMHTRRSQGPCLRTVCLLLSDVAVCKTRTSVSPKHRRQYGRPSIWVIIKSAPSVKQSTNIEI